MLCEYLQCLFSILQKLLNFDCSDEFKKSLSINLFLWYLNVFIIPSILSFTFHRGFQISPYSPPMKFLESWDISNNI